MSVPQIRIAAIEAIARKILMEYDPALLEGEPCAIPIETIIETKFDLILEYHILRKNGSILGETIFDDGAVILYDQYQHEYRLIGVKAGTILIDERLCEPQRLGRLRFTCGHELAHWVLHKKLYTGTGDVAAYDGNSSTDESNGIIERQADAMATALLMPLPQVKKCFYRLRSGRSTEQLIYEMSQIFAVSKQAMQIRLQSHKGVAEYTVREIHKLLRNAFNQAVRWELIARNPVLNATLPKEEHKEREIWTADMLAKAMEVCDDPILLLALNLAFSCSLRMGEMLGLTWDCVDVSPHSIDAGNASIFVNKELQRVTRGALDDLSDKGVIKKFPPCIASTHTALVLKEPKTKTSIRRVYLPKTVAKMLVDRKAEIDELKDLFGDEYIDNDLVFCTSNGRPMESQIINRAFNKLIKENGFPHVVFHSLRHSSITYKLKLNGGDMKAVQGDSGHAQMKMVADVYSHIIDEDRCINAQRFEDAFYSQAKAPEPAIQEVEEKETGTTTPESDTAKILELLKNPETAALLKQIVSAL